MLRPSAIAPFTETTVPPTMASNQVVPTALKPLAMMTKLSPFVSVYEPAGSSSSSSEPSDSNDAPKLILVASWMDARDLHIAKYVSRYQTLFPSSKILLVKSIFKQVLWGLEGVKAVEPAIPYLRSQVDSGYLSASPSKPDILVHLFSNGGVATTKRLSQVYRQKTGQAFPLHAAVYDSCPGVFGFWGSYKAIMMSVPKGILLRWILAPFIHFFNLAVLFSEVVLRRPSGITANAIYHNDPTKLQQIVRTYIYSRNDLMIDWRHVENHAKQAQAAGFKVRRKLFDGAHVAHMMSDKERYWKVVMETWKTAVQGA